MNISDTIRQNIKEFREEKGLTQEQMAEKLHMSTTGYAKLERGETKINPDRLQQIAQILEVGIFELQTPRENGQVIFSNNDNFQNFSLFFGNGAQALQIEIDNLNKLILAKNEILDSREREIKSLKEQIILLKELIATLKNTP